MSLGGRVDFAADGAGPDGAGELEKTLFEQARIGLEVYDSQLRILRSNRAALAIRGLRESQVVGANIGDLDVGLHLSPLIEKVLEKQSPVFDWPLSAVPATDPGRSHEYAVTAYLVERPEHLPTLAAAAIDDVTEQVRKQRDLDLLNLAQTGVGSTLDPMRTAQELAGTTVPNFADAVAVDVMESVFTGDAPTSPVALRLPMRRSGFKSHEGEPPAYPVGGASPYNSHSPYSQALADLRPQLVANLSATGGWLAHDRPRREFIVSSGVHSLIVTPLTVHGLVMGLASFYRARSHPEPFNEDDLSLATQLAARTALCLDNARRFTREHTVATTLQRSLLPWAPPETPAVEPSYCYRSGRYGAHWFDVLPLPSCRAGLIIGYVPGEDLQASLAMGRLRTAASTLASLDLPPDELMTHLDNVAQRLARERDADPASLHHARPPFTASCLYMVYDPVTQQCSGTSAGHDSPLLTSPEGVVTVLELTGGPPLGQGVPYELSTVELLAGSLLTLFSDGSAERYPAEARARTSRLREAVRSTAPPKQVSGSVAYKVLHDTTPEDGVALLVARTRRIAPDRVSSWEFPPEAPSVGEARRSARRQLTQWGLEDHTPLVDLVVSELATNVIRHATGPIGLRLIFDRSLTVEVHDDADTTPHLRHAGPQDEGGRGLFLVASLAQHWGTRHEGTGKTIWADMDTQEGA